MIFDLLTGRTGNQMFQYATMRALQEKYYPNEKIRFVLSDMKKGGKEEDGFYVQLDDFTINREKVEFGGGYSLSVWQRMLLVKYYAVRKVIKFFTRKEKYEIAKRKYERKIQKEYNKFGLYLFSYGFYPFERSDKCNKLCLGFFESPRYFDDIKDILLEEFKPAKPRRVENERLYEIIDGSESVCVSIRRGDYINTRFEKGAYVCTPEYFDLAIDYVRKKIEKPVFVVFSDDINWVKDNMSFPEGTVFERGDDPVWEKLRLMYSCKHFIISNSTFSWWAQYLCRNKKKVVVAPKVWRKIGYQGEDLYEQNWKLIDIGGGLG